MSSDRDGPFLEASGLTKSFDGNVVLSGVDLVLRKGEVHAIVGENGAGKSTLIKTLGGVHRPDAGRLLVDGQDTVLRSPADAIARGIVVIHQELSLAPHLSVAENIFLGHFLRNRIGLVDRRRMHDETRALLTRLNIDIDPKTLAVDLPIAQQQMVEIAKAISFNAKVLILDEPTAVLDEDMVDTLFDLIATLKSQGIAIVFISHHLEEIFRIADTVTVLRDGKRTGLSAVAEVDQNWLVSRMIGRDFPAFLASERSTGEPALEVRGLTLPGVFEDISFTAHKGEIVGLAGLVGAGRTEVARAICGITPAVLRRGARLRACCQAAHAEGRDAAGDGLCHRGPQGARPAAQSPGARERHDLQPVALSLAGISRPRQGAQLCERAHPQARHPPAGHGCGNPHAERRQPAEGAARPCAGRRPAHPGVRRANPRRRHRRQERDLRHHRAARLVGHVRDPDFVGARGDPAPGRQGRRAAPGESGDHAQSRARRASLPSCMPPRWPAEQRTDRI